MLEDGGADLDGAAQAGILPYEIGTGQDHDAHSNPLALLGRFLVKDGEKRIDDGNHRHQVPYHERHGSNALGASFREFIGKIGEGETVLVETHPEEDDHGEYQEEGDHAFFCLLRRKGVHHLGFFTFPVTAFHVLEPAATGVVDGDGDNEGDAGHGKGEVVGGVSVKADGDGPLADLDGGGRGEEGADIDGHVEQGEAGIPLGGKLGLVVEVTYHHLEVAFEQACSEAYQDEGGNHGYQGGGASSQRDGKQQVAQEHDDDAGGDHLPEAEFIGHDTSDEGEEVHQHEEGTVDGSRRSCRKAEVGPEEEGEHGNHGVIAKPFTGVGECQGEKPFGLSFKHISITLLFDRDVGEHGFQVLPGACHGGNVHLLVRAVGVLDGRTYGNHLPGRIFGTHDGAFQAAVGGHNLHGMAVNFLELLHHHLVDGGVQFGCPAGITALEFYLVGPGQLIDATDALC